MLKFLLTTTLLLLFITKALATAPEVNSTKPLSDATISVRDSVIEISYNQALYLKGEKLTSSTADSLITILRNQKTVDTTEYSVVIEPNKMDIKITFNTLLSQKSSYSITVGQVEDKHGEASDPFTLNFSTGALVSINDLTFSTKLCAGETANLASITINEGFIGNFYNTTEGGNHQDIQLELSDKDNLSFNIDNAVLSVNDGDFTDLNTYEVKFFLNKGNLMIGFTANSVSANTLYVDKIRLVGVKVVTKSNITPGEYKIKVAHADSSFPGLEVGQVVGTITVNGYETVSLINSVTNDNTSPIEICPGDEVVFTPNGGTAPYTFYKNGTELAQGTTYTTTTLSDGDGVYVVSSGSSTTCSGQSNTITVEIDNTPPEITLTDIEDQKKKYTVENGQIFAIPATSVGLQLSADQDGTFSGVGVNTSNNEFLTTDPAVDKEPGLYEILFKSKKYCKPDVSFTIEIFDNSRNQLLGLQNSGICYNISDPIPIGWLGEGVDGDLVSITSTPNVLTGNLNTGYNGGLSSGYFIAPDMVQNSTLTGDTLTFKINYTPKGEPDVTKVLTQDVVIAQTPKLVTSLMRGDSIKASYCQNSPSIELLGNPPGGLGISKTFSILNLDTATNISSAVPLEDMNLHFDPTNASVPQNFLAPNNKGYVISFEYISEYGCSAVRNDTVRVLPLPGSIFTDTLTFNYCIGDDIGKLFVAEVDSLDIVDSLEYLWYDERENLLQEETSYSFNTGISNQFPSTTSYFVSQRLVDYGCVGPLSELEVNVGENPVAEFSFAESCAIGTLSFTDESKGGIVPKDRVNQWVWSFNDPGGAGSSTQTNPFYAFSEPGIYDVKLKVLTSVGCSDSIVHSVATYTYPPIDLSNNIYFEGFEQSAAGWISTTETEQANGLANNSSWRLTIPEGNLINETQTGNHAWITSNPVTTVYNDNEDSWVESPCFNLNLWDRPKIEMDIWYNTEKFEGATLQYAIKGDKLSAADTKWETVGSIGSGIEWFNSTGISAAPGGQALGWEGSVSGWKSAKISLDGVKEKAAGQPVRFRIAFASLELGDNRENKFDGFAFDNFAIRERNRMVVLEHFTNVNAANNEKENTYIDNFVAARPAEVIKIEYHTDFPGLDPVNKLNTADPSAHALEYGISEVPRTVMDGIYGVYYRNDPFSTDGWGEDAYTLRANIDAPFNLTISDNIITGGANPHNPGESLKIDVTITKNPTADTISSPLVLEIGILQKSLEANGRTYHNVLRKLLPNAAGNYIYGDWLPNDISRTETVTQYWSPDFMHDPADTFLIVAYVHDTHLSKTRTKEIYQGAYKQINILPPTAPVTGLNNGTNQGFKIYPNPSKGDAILVFDQPLIEDSPIKVYSSTGLQIYEGNITKGATSFKIPLESCPEGLYIVSFYAQDRIIRLPHILR